MTTENLYDALEICLNALEQGADIESCLVRFPALADELRLILETAAQARASAVEDVPVDAMRRGKARVLQAAAEMREQAQRKPLALPFWRRPSSSARTFRLAFTVLAVVLFLLTGGTGLVSASSGALPGDNLYSVKRTWEGVRLLFTLNQHSHEKLKSEFEQERVREIDELFSEGRLEQVNFQGVVQSQQGEIWLIDGIKIKVSDDAVVSAGIIPGAVVQVTGGTDDGIIEAEQVVLIESPAATFTPSPTLIRPTTETPSPAKREMEAPETESTIDMPETPEADATEIGDSGEEKVKTPETDKTIEPTKTQKASDSGSDSNDKGSGGQDGSGKDSDSSSGDENSGSGGGDGNSGSGGGSDG